MALVLGNRYTLTLPLGQRVAALLGYTERDIELLFPFKEKVFYSLMRESGYMHIQSTKPDTVGECSCLAGVSTGGRRIPPPCGALYIGQTAQKERSCLGPSLHCPMQASPMWLSRSQAGPVKSVELFESSQQL